jgi:hypothetical protein
MAGKKDDAGKPDWTLMPWVELAQVQDVLDHGARKYGRENWKEVSNPKARYLAALIRHFVSYASGDTSDDDSGLPHMAHVVCCALFLMHFDRKDAEYGCPKRPE